MSTHSIIHRIYRTPAIFGLIAIAAIATFAPAAMAEPSEPFIPSLSSFRTFLIWIFWFTAVTGVALYMANQWLAFKIARRTLSTPVVTRSQRELIVETIKDFLRHIHVYGLSGERHTITYDDAT